MSNIKTTTDEMLRLKKETDHLYSEVYAQAFATVHILQRQNHVKPTKKHQHCKHCAIGHEIYTCADATQTCK